MRPARTLKPDFSWPILGLASLGTPTATPGHSPTTSVRKALKNPLPRLVIGLSSAVVAGQGGLCHSPLALPEECCWGIADMNDNEAILAELRKISAWADMQRTLTKWSLIAVAVVIPAMIIVGILVERRVETHLGEIAPGQKPDWYDVDQNVRAGDFDKAIRIGEELLPKTPQYPEAHRRLAGAYLAAGKIEKARAHYAEAFRLFPSDENEKLLVAIEKRSNAENSRPAGAADGSQPIRSETNRTSSATGSRR